MQLHFSKLGKGKNLVILHGLYGSGNNWISIAHSLSENFTVYLIDQRNHGLSPHSPSHNYDAMADDLRELCSTLHLDKLYIIGHSMGGKTAITFTLKFPELVEKLIVVDISPFSYLEQEYYEKQFIFHKTILRLFNDAPIQNASSRAEIEFFFNKELHDIETSKFLLKNLKRSKEGSFMWQLNIDSLSRNLESIMDSVPPVKKGISSYTPALFLKGGKSEYLSVDDIRSIPDVFPDVKFEIFENAGHWLHFQYPEQFIERVTEFLQ